MIGAFQTKVMKRFMSEKQLQNFWDEYRDHTIKKVRSKMVTDKDLLILHDYRKGMGTSELARKYKLTYPRVLTSLRYAALAKLHS